MNQRSGGYAVDALLLTFVLLNAVWLAMLELFFLPLYIGSVAAPLSVLVAAVTTPWLVSQAGAVADRIGLSARVAAVPLVLWLATVAGFGLFGPGGDTVLVLDWRGLALLAAGTVPGALALGLALGRSAHGKIVDTRRVE